MGEFRGTDAERAELQRNGFVITSRSLRQHFSAYEPDAEHPYFVTTDAVLHAYAHALTKATLELDRRAAPLLRRWTLRLIHGALDHDGQAAEDAARFLSVGLALQEAEPSQRVAAIASWRQGSLLAKTLLADKRLDDPVFDVVERPFSDHEAMIASESSYSDEQDLHGYFQARRYFQVCRFKESPRGRAAEAFLAGMVAGDRDLKSTYAVIQRPFRKLFGPPSWRRIVDPGQTAWVASPQLRPSLLPPCEVPSSIIFRQTTHPGVSGRMIPSGMDLLVVGPFASKVGRRLFERSSVFDAEVLKVRPPPLPDSVLGRSLALLDQLTDPLPETAPPTLKTMAWREKQCATQLAAWAEMRMAARLHGRILTILCRSDTPQRPPHRVSPYPAFFHELASLARSTAKILEELDRRIPFDPVEAAKSLAAEGRARSRSAPPSRIERMLDSDWGSTLGTRQRRIKLTRLLERARRGKPMSESDLRTLKALAAGGEHASQRLAELGKLCDTLSAIAARQLEGKVGVDADQRFLDSIGEKLARLQGYSSNSWLRPRDDLPDVTVVARPLQGRRFTFFHIGVARPRQLILLLPHGDLNALYQGVVGSYREFDSTSRLATSAWRESCDSSQPLFGFGK